MKTTRIVGWVLSVLIVVFLVGVSAMGKFTDWEGKEEMFTKMGFTSELMWGIGILEVVCAILYIVPRGVFLGAILLTGYLGGATVTHVRVGDPYAMPVVMGVLLWVALGLRQPEVFQLAFGLPSAPESSPSPEG